MTSYQHLCEWPEARLQDLVYMLEARRGNFQADCGAYLQRCHDETFDHAPAIELHTECIVDELNGQLATVNEALEHVRGLSEQADARGLERAMRERQI